MNEREKVFKTIERAGVSSIVLGIIVLVTGIAAGVLTIINGARLLKRKSNTIRKLRLLMCLINLFNRIIKIND